MTVDGRVIARGIFRTLKSDIAGLGRQLRLGIIVAGHDPVVESFVRIKTRAAKRLGIEIVRRDMPDRSSTDDIIEETKKLGAETNALIVQLPLPEQVDVEAVLSAVPPEKDVDAINPAVSEDQRIVHAPVALAVMEILKRHGVETAGKRAIVVGAGRLVGAPTAALLGEAGARVSIVRKEEGSLGDLANADIAVLGAGEPGFIKPEMLKRGVALIDGGASESAGKIVGDADPACADIASVFTPVPGGVGPVAVAMIYRNLLALAQKTA